MFTVIFAAATFILTPLQAQHAEFCRMLTVDGLIGASYYVESDSCMLVSTKPNQVPLILEGEEIGAVKTPYNCDGMVPVKECTAEF